MEETMGDMKVSKEYQLGENQATEILNLRTHLDQYNRRFNAKLSLSLPKRSKRKDKIIGRAKDHNHLLYQGLMDAILLNCTKPLTTGKIAQELINQGEKPTTARMISPCYLELIGRVLDPETKRHRRADETLLKWGEF